MKICVISSFALTTPPMKDGKPSYGGLEKVAYEVAAGLKELGHEVALIASKGSLAPGGVQLMDIVTSWEKLTQDEQYKQGKADRVWNGWRAHEETAFQLYQESLPYFDVVIDNSWSKWSWTTKKEEIIGVCHSQKPYMKPPPRAYPMICGVSRGHSRFLSRELGIPAKTLLNCVPVHEYPFQKDKGDRILSLNRIMPTKGIHHFVNLCEKDFIFGDIAGDDSTLVQDQNYVAHIKERCAGSAYLTYHGLVDDTKRVDLLKNAKCLVCFKDGGYEEVFGLMAVEALSCGTPVVAMRSWGFEDIIEHGKSGFIVDRIEEVPSFIAKVKEISPDDCRARAKYFSRYNRSLGYERAVKRVKEGTRW